MSFWGAASVLVALTLGQQGYTASVETIAAETESDIIGIDTEKHMRMTVPVMVGDDGPYDFIIDTGAQVTVIARELADDLALHDREPARLIALNSESEVEITDIRDVALGSRVMDLYGAPLIERTHLGGADGMLGLDSLREQSVLLDFENQHIAVAAADEMGNPRGFEIVVRARDRAGQLIITDAEIDGVRVAVMIDTGAQGSTGNLELQRRLRRARDGSEATLTDINGVSSISNVVIARELSFDRARLGNVPVTFADSPTFAALGLSDRPAMILGMNELRLFDRVAIDFERRRLLFDLPNGVRSHRRSRF